MSGEFGAAAPVEIVHAIARFFGECPPRVEMEGVEFTVGPTPAALTPARALTGCRSSPPPDIPPVTGEVGGGR